MNKKIMVSIVGLIIVFFLFGLVWNLAGDRKEKENNMNEEVNVSIEDMVTDECTEEWYEYNNELQSAFEDASSEIVENTTHYLIKSENGYICVYYLNDENEELLYKKTDISIDYLSPEDVSRLMDGIVVVGSEELNKILEDFE